MTTTTRIAFYLGRRDENPNSKIGDWGICHVTESRFSHVELLSSITSADVVVEGQINKKIIATMYSSSLRDKGVRGVTKQLYTDRWVIVEISGDSKPAIQYIINKIGTKYGLLDLAGFLLPIDIDTVGEFCSEITTNGLSHAKFNNLPVANKTAPEHLFLWAKKQPGFRIVPAGELHRDWVA